MVLKTKKLQGQEKIKQIEHHDRAGAQATTMPVLSPGEVLTPADLISGTFAVPSGCLLRIKVSGDTYIQFSENAIGAAPGAATTDALLVDATVNGGWHLIRVPTIIDAAGVPSKDVIVRLSAAPTRAENLGQ